MDRAINFTITPVWAIIEHIRKKISSELSAELDQSIVDAATICAVELVENAVKYGESVPNMQYIQFSLNYQHNTIEVRVSNGVVNPEDLKTVTDTIDAINAGSDPDQLYLKRLTALMESQGLSRSQLGIYRIASETGFVLQYEVVDNSITVIATRKVI